MQVLIPHYHVTLREHCLILSYNRLRYLDGSLRPFEMPERVRLPMARVEKDNGRLSAMATSDRPMDRKSSRS